MAAVYDAGATSAATSAASSVTWSHTVGIRPKRILLAWTAYVRAAGGSVSATYAGQAMTLISNDVPMGNVAGDFRFSSAYILEPTTGANNVVFSYTQNCDWIAGSLSYYNVRGYGGATHADIAALSSLNVARACVANDLVVGMLGYAEGDDNLPTSFTPQAEDVERVDIHAFVGTASHQGLYGGQQLADSTSETVGAVWLGNQNACIDAVNLQPWSAGNQVIWTL